MPFTKKVLTYVQLLLESRLFIESVWASAFDVFFLLESAFNGKRKTASEQNYYKKGKNYRKMSKTFLSEKNKKKLSHLSQLCRKPNTDFAFCNNFDIFYFIDRCISAKKISTF